MVPRKLVLRNFLSYGDQPQVLDLQGIHVAALVGNNGVGKSALLDAVTFALFGKARSKNEQLMRKGARETSVQLEFEVNGQLFRILRRLQRKGESVSQTVTFEEWTGRNWRPLVRDGVRAAEETILRLLRMDYDTFVNTVFMPQGESGAFMNLNPTERREMLARALGLEVYEELSEKAREKTKTLSGQIEASKQRLTEIEDELKQRPAAEQAFRKVQQERERAFQAFQLLEEEIAQIQKRRESLLQDKVRLEELQAKKQALQRQLANTRHDLQEREREMERWQEVLREEERIVEAWQKFQKVQKAEAALGEKARQLQELQQQRHQLEQALLKAKGDLEATLRGKKSDLANRRQRLQQLQTLLSRREEVERQLQELEKARGILKEWDEKQRQWQALQQERAQWEQVIASERAKWEAWEKHWQQTQNKLRLLLEARPKVEAAIREREEVRKRLTEHLRRLEEWRTRREQLGKHIAALETQREQLQKILQETSEKLQLLQTHEGEPKCPLCETTLTPQKVTALRRRFAKELEQHTASLQKREQQIAQAREQVTKLEEYLKAEPKLREQLSRVEQQLGELRGQLAEIERAEGELQRLEEEWEAMNKERAKMEGNWEREYLAFTEREKAIGYDPQVHQQWRKKVETFAKAEAEWEQICQAEKEWEREKGQVQELESEVAKLQRKLEAEDFAHEERAQLQQVVEAIRQLNYDPRYHQQLREWLQKNQDIPQRWQKLQTAKELVPTLQSHISQMRQQIAETERALSEVEEKERELQERLAALSTVEEELAELQGRRQARQNELLWLNQEIGALRRRLEELGQRAQEREQLRQRLDELANEKQDYELLAEAFGHYGIPEMLLRVAVHWLEGEASRLLAQLTRGRMHLRFALEKPWKTKEGQKGTLDIIVGDDLGDRPYEVFSGGERFRIDFAVRLALARLLAHRVGASIQTLIIDEGFGSQDKEGLEAMVEAIQTVAEEFQRVLVVTHLDELRDRFPVLIEVTKEATGSRLRVIDRNSQSPEPLA